MKTITFTVPGPAPGKPRQTRRDKWAKRPCVMRYRAWADLVRLACPHPPVAASVEEITITAYYKPPQSWTAGKAQRAIGTKKRTRCDGDNILKAACDALWPDDDAAVGDAIVRRRWGDVDHTVVDILVKE